MAILLSNLKGGKGDKGEKGDQGNPGVNSVTNDAANASNIVTPGTLTKGVLDQGYAPEGAVIRSKVARLHRTIGVSVGRALFLGDSWTEGTRGSDAPFLRYVDHLTTGLRRAMNPATAFGGMYIPSYTTYPTRIPANWVFAGTTTQRQNTGPGFFNVEMQLAATATLAFTGTGFRVMWDRRTDSGNATVTIDGVSVGTINANGAINNGMATDFTGLTPGKHTIVITVTSGAIFSLQGAYVYNGDEAEGMRTYPAGRGGITSAMLTSANLGPLVSSTSPDLVTVQLGVNDYRTNIPVATYKANLAAGVATINASQANRASIVLISAPETLHPGTPVAPWADYVAALKEVAADNGLLVVDLDQGMGSAVTSGGNGLWDVDQVHPNDAGHRLIANTILAAVLPENVRAPVPHERLWVPAASFLSATGTGPEAKALNNAFGAWFMDAAATETVVANPAVPPGWRSFTLDLWWVNTTAGTGAVRWRVAIGTLAAGQAATQEFDTQTVITAGALAVATRSQYFTGLTTDPSGLMRIMISRMGADATDTLTGDAGLLGVMLTRTS